MQYQKTKVTSIISFFFFEWDFPLDPAIKCEHTSFRLCVLLRLSVILFFIIVHSLCASDIKRDLYV